MVELDSAATPPQNFIVADKLASHVRPGAGSKKREFPSLTITEPA